MSMDHSQVFSEDYWRPVLLPFYLLTLMLITALTVSRFPPSIKAWKNASATQMAIAFTLVDSLIYVCLSTYEVFGLGSSRSASVSLQPSQLRNSIPRTHS